MTTTRPPTRSRVYVPGSSQPTNAKGQPYRLATYVVRKGDNLTVIARWFSYNGYGQLFRQNRTKVSDPDLIYPGQVLTVWSSGGMTVGS